MSGLRKPEFLQGKLANCLTWLKEWPERWNIAENDRPEFMNAITKRVDDISKDKDNIALYCNETFLMAFMSQDFLRSFFLTLHKFYKLSGDERNNEVDKLLVDGRTLVTKITEILNFAEANKDLLKQDLFKAGAYTEIFFWPYLYAEK